MFNRYVKHLLDVWVVGVCNLIWHQPRFNLDLTQLHFLSWKENGLTFSRFSQKVQKGLPYQRVSRHLKFHIWLKSLSIPCKSLVLAKFKSLPFYLILMEVPMFRDIDQHNIMHKTCFQKSHQTMNLFLSLPATARETTK